MEAKLLLFGEGDLKVEAVEVGEAVGEMEVVRSGGSGAGFVIKVLTGLTKVSS